MGGVAHAPLPRKFRHGKIRQINTQNRTGFRNIRDNIDFPTEVWIVGGEFSVELSNDFRHFVFDKNDGQRPWQAISIYRVSSLHLAHDIDSQIAKVKVLIQDCKHVKFLTVVCIRRNFGCEVHILRRIEATFIPRNNQPITFVYLISYAHMPASCQMKVYKTNRARLLPDLQLRVRVLKYECRHNRRYRPTLHSPNSAVP